MAFEVNDTVANLSGASGRFTAGEFSEGVTRVSVTEDLTNEDILVRLQGLGPRHRAGVRLCRRGRHHKVDLEQGLRGLDHRAGQHL